MCHYIEASHVMPGWACCKCRTYNGLQRPHCKKCKQVRHKVEVPKTVTQCKKCGFGFPKKDLMSIVQQFKGLCPTCPEKVAL